VVHYLQFVTGIPIKLGHKSSKTTEIYTHVSNKNIGKIKSPLDLIIKNSYIENEVEGDEG
jgi:hypothetical protein